MSERNSHSIEQSMCQRFTQPVEALVNAYRYSNDTHCDRWEFAVEISQLRQWGMTPTDLRWFVKKGYVDHACEITVEGDPSRRFRTTGKVSFKKRTCFVLTARGYELAVQCLGDSLAGPSDSAESSVKNAGRCEKVPKWDSDLRELRLGGVLVKHFKWQAVNQESILSAFEEEGWPKVIDDPLPPKEEHDTKRRLLDTIKSLNRNQKENAIRFRGNGTGEGVIWEFTTENDSTE